MRSVGFLITTTLLLACCGDRDAPATSYHTIALTFRVKTGDAVTTKAMSTVLVATKPGRMAVVDVSAEEAPKGTISGRHRFPPGVTAAAISAYYEGLLRNAGWGETDLRVERGAGRLHFLRVGSAHGWSAGEEIELRFHSELR